MTSEIDVTETNEFLRRRKLRLQQVREQSKDIAKKIRQRAKVEKLRQVINLDTKKEKEYFKLQEKLVGRLEQLYSESLQNVGSGHKNVADAIGQEDPKKDLSKIRGREAVAEVRKRKQQKLDEQNKFLERRLQAREAANELSREKCAVVSKTISFKSTDNKNIEQSSTNPENNNNLVEQKDKADTETSKNDMATQWEGDELPNESGSSVPKISLPKDDKDSFKYLGNDTEKSDPKRLNLFALSDEMPSSLRGGNLTVPYHIPQQKSSVTLVSEYLQTRNLRLREVEPISTKKSDDLQSLKETIQRTRASKTDVSGKSEKSKISTENTLNRQNSVTMYNHSTRDTRDVLYNNERLVIREQNMDDDAYTKALKETSIFDEVENRELKKRAEMRHKTAVSKENVDKDYKDTLAFLTSLSKEKSSRPNNISHMDHERQQMQSEKRQKKLQEEFKNIERECKKRTCKHKNRSALNKSRSKSPETFDGPPRNFQYDWMPVPDSDGKLAVHSLPSTRNQKTSNTVKFNDVDTYHEYRSRHKHTPPTKDVPKNGGRKRIVETLIIEQDSSDNTDSTSATSDSNSVEKLNDNKYRTDKDFLNDPRLSDGDRIVIYKILDSKRDKKQRDDKKNKLLNKSKSISENPKKSTENDNIQENTIDLENLNEGIYKVGESGIYNIMSCYTSNVDMWKTSTERKPWWDNIASMYFSENNQDVRGVTEQQGVCKKSVTCQNGSEQQQHSINISQSQNRCDHSCYSCKCSRTIQQPQTSAVTSTSSFQTAVNDKTGNLMADGGFIKLIDDGGQDSGKFYIGASGFLKDENYEVVIQLKKKETEKLDSKSQKEVLQNTVENLPSPTNNITNVDTEVQSSLGIHLKEGAAQTSINKEGTDNDENAPCSKSDSVPEIQVTSENGAFNKSVLIENRDHNEKYKIDKNVNTTFQESFAIPDHVPKTDPILRPATSTYTQTSFSSPNSRPIFMQMTSSTSTAYMSPPELILPRFLNRNRISCTDEDLLSNDYDQNNDEGFPSIKCKCARKVASNEKIRKCKHICSTTDTPPNTARSYDYNGSMSEYVETGKLKHKHKSKMCRKTHKHKSNFTLHRKSNKSIPYRGTSSTAIFSKKSEQKITHIPDVANKNGFNPMLKEYVNKLLALNKEGLKAISVINQDCSSVDTPRSSIINTPYNVTKKGAPLDNKISLEQIKIMLEQQIVKDYAKRALQNNIEKQYKDISKQPKRKQVHKVKSLNISRHFFKNKNSHSNNSYSQVNFKRSTKLQSSSSSTKKSLLPNQEDKEGSELSLTKVKSRSKSSPTPRRPIHNNITCNDNLLTNSKVESNKTPLQQQRQSQCSSNGTQGSDEGYRVPHRSTSVSTDSDRRYKKSSLSQIPPTDISTQTSVIDSEINFMKLAENKLQNMEKIADLTEKCTKRLSNLAKVLEEVRKNKSLVYSHISTSDSTSDSEPKHQKINNVNQQMFQSDEAIEKNYNKPIIDVPFQEQLQKDSYIPLLKDIPKPLTPSTLSLSTISEKSNIPTSTSSVDQTKHKAKPPPSRINLKNLQDNFVIPHELSTVIEVDSPMSVKLKNQSSRRELHQEVSDKFHTSDNEKQVQYKKDDTQPKYQSDLDLQLSKANLSKHQSRALSDSSNDAKIEMMDMKLFNEIMLKPFVSLQEYAKQHEVCIDNASNVDNVLKDDQVCDDLSSLHSDGSLPDVISELLKRKIISEPFKFDTASHVTTSLSSESSFSLLALSKIHKEKNKANRHVMNKENITETSETLSISSNPDLENAFQKLGMGWASSTLKKTKERLALSSSSNTSSSSYSQLKFKSFNKDPPTIANDSSLSGPKKSNKKFQFKNIDDIAKNAVQQTSLTNSMTVKEFLTNELAKKITFTNNSNRNTDEEFISLYETKMPEEMRNTPENVVENEQSVASQGNNRARTSTPVQIFKSTTYHTTSSSNTSNGLFSNADELSSVKVTSTSIRNHSTSDKDDLTIPNYSLKRKGLSDNSKSD